MKKFILAVLIGLLTMTFQSNVSSIQPVTVKQDIITIWQWNVESNHYQSDEGFKNELWVHFLYNEPLPTTYYANVRVKISTPLGYIYRNYLVYHDPTVSGLPYSFSTAFIIPSTYNVVSSELLGYGPYVGN